MIINGYELQMTCSACPEQYDVFLSGKQVGYLRLRHGHFRAEVPDCLCKIVYESDTNGDGMFTDDEREFHLMRAIEAIEKELNNA